jgi:hypothetical protein
MLQLKPQSKAHTEHMLFVLPSTEILYSPWPALYSPTTPTLDVIFLFSYVNSSLSDAQHWKLSAGLLS